MGEPSLEHRPAVTGQELSGLAESAMLAGAGGALDAFTYLGHGHVFANAMTGNVVLLGLNAVQGDWPQSLRHLLPILSFFLGVTTAEAIKVRLVWNKIRDPNAAVLSLEIAIFGILGALPASAPDSVITVCVAFAASLQTATFRTVEGHPYNSTFTTGNLRTLSQNLFAWFTQKDSPALQRIVRVFATICGSFLLGVMAGGLLTPFLHNQTLWLICIPLALLWRRSSRKPIQY